MIDLTPLTEDLNIHQSLDNQPALTAQELKVAWDSPAAKIKTYLNNLTQTELPADLNTELTNTLNAAKSYTDTAIAGISQAAEDISFDNTGTGLQATNVQDAIEETKTNLGNSINSLTSQVTTLNAKIRTQDFNGTFNNMGDWEYTANLTPSIPSGYVYLTANWVKFTSDGDDAKTDEPKQPFYRPDTGKIVVHIGSGQIGRLRNHGYTIRAFYIKIN